LIIIVSFALYYINARNSIIEEVGLLFGIMHRKDLTIPYIMKRG